MNGDISELLSKYGTSLEETRKLVPELTEAVRKRKVVKPPALPSVPQFFTADEVRGMRLVTETGEPFELELDWKLKVTPGVNGAEPSFSYITPEEWEITQDQKYISPEGQVFTREQLEAQLAAPEVPLEVEQVFGRVFPERDVWETLNWIAESEENQEAFLLELAELRLIGKAGEVETLLRTLFPEITEEQIEGLIPPRFYRTPEGYLAYTEEWLWERYAEAYRAPEYAGIPDWAKVFAVGAGDLMVIAGGAMKWLGHDGIGERWTSEGQKLLPLGADIPMDANWDTLFSPRFYAFRPTAEHGYQVVRTLPFWLSLAPAAILGAYGGAAVAGAIGLGTLGTTVLATLGASILASPMEAALEAGGTWDEALDKGLSPEEAKEAADSVFKKNLMLLGATNWAEFLAAFAPMPVKVPASLILKGLVTTVRVGGRVTITGLTQAGEEACQEIFVRQALGEEIVLDDEMKAAIAIGGIMGMGLGGVGDIFTSIRYKTKENLSPDLKIKFDKDVAAFKERGFTLDQAELKALDKVAETTEGAKIVTEAVEAVKQKELLNQIKPKTEAEQVAWEHMFKDFPEATTPVEVPMNLEGLRGVARLKGYTISDLKVPISKMPGAKFRITGKGVRVYARDLLEVQTFLQTGSLVIPQARLNRMRGELAHALFEASEGRGYFKDAAGFKDVVNKMSDAEMRDLHAMYVRTGKIAEPVLGVEYTSQEIMEKEAELTGLQEWLTTEPAAKLLNLVKKVGWYRGEVSNLTLKQYRGLTGKRDIPPSILTPDKKHVRWEYALDDTATEMGYASGEDLKYAIENVNEAEARIKNLKAEIASITPEMRTEAELQANREKMLEQITQPRIEGEIPRGTVRHPSHYKGQEDFTAEIHQELFTPIKESSLDRAACSYLETGDFVEYINHMPTVSEMKLRALSDEVKANIAELEELLAAQNRQIELLGVEISLEKPTSEKFKTGQRDITQLERDARFCEKLIKELKVGEHLTIEDAVALGIALRETKGGNLVPAIRKSGFYVTTEFTESPHLQDVPYVSGFWQDVDALFEHIDGGRAAGVPGDPVVAQEYMQRPSNRNFLAYKKFLDTNFQVCQDIFEKYDLAGNTNLIKASFDIIQQIGAEDVAVPTDQLLGRPEIKKLVAQYRPEVQRRLVGFSQEVRSFLDEVVGMENQARAKRGQELIGYIEKYLSWVAERNIWSTFGFAKRTPAEIHAKPPAPDFIFPDAPFNKHAMAREGGMRGYPMEKNVHKLLFDYIRTAGKDIFFSNTVQNNKIHIAALRSLGKEHTATLLEEYNAEVWSGMRPRITKAYEAFLPKPMARATYMIRRNLTRNVFPLNWIWSVTIQPSSIAFTSWRTGILNVVRGLDFLFIPSANRFARGTYTYTIKQSRAGKMAFQDIGAQVTQNLKWEGNFIDKAEHLANFMVNTIEKLVTGISIRAGYHYGKSLGFTGEELVEYASKMGAKTQSMYNYENVPAVLRAKPVGTNFPFQTFTIQAMNTVREMDYIRVGKAGAYQTISAKSAQGQATISRRIKLTIEFLITIMVINMVVDKATNRKPWILSSFIPMFSLFSMGAEPTNPWNMLLPARYINEFYTGLKQAIQYEDFTKLKKWILSYHFPFGGTQINRMLDGIEAVIKGGVYDVRGTELFEVRPDEWLKAIFMGPYQTEGGREYIDKLQEKQGKWYEYFRIPLPKRVSIKNEIDRNLAQLGQVGEEGEVYNFKDFVSDLRELRRAVGDKRFEASDSPFVQAFLEAEASRERYELYVLEHWGGLIPEEILDIGKEPTQGQRDEWRASHPQDDARLAMWGYGGRIQTQEAYDLVKGWCKELGISMEHLSCWLPPEDIAGTYFKYIGAVNEFSAGSAEARLIRLEDPDFQTWGKEAYDWKDIDTHIESLRISVKWGELDDKYDTLDSEGKKVFLEANPEYADDRRRRDAYNLGLGEAVVKTSQRWWLEGIANDFALVLDIAQGKEFSLADQSLLQELSDIMSGVLKGIFPTENDRLRLITLSREAVDHFLKYEGLTSTERNAIAGALAEAHDFLEDLPQMSRDKLLVSEVSEKVNLVETYVEWYKTPRKGYEDDWFLMEHKDFYAEMVKLKQLKERDFSKVPDIKYKGLWGAEWEEMDAKYEVAEDKKAFLEANFEYHQVFRQRQAITKGLPEKQFENYVDYYTNPALKKPVDWEYDYWYEDDWFLQEHPDFYKAMLDLKIWTKERDFSLVPTRKVFKLYEEWLDLPLGAARREFEAKNPDLDLWLHRKFGTMLETERKATKPKVVEPEKEKPSAPEKPKTPWEEAEEAERIKEWIEGLK